ncbi:MAG: salicylate hydroxylase Nah [Pseudomonadota bacterium]|jgi:2-polyprenyl-6-methoxyphenol hydroxylase-like FAD-dependent oxidoreductase
MGSTPPIAIVGASLAGLTLALACASRGVPVHVFERAARRVRGGDSLSVDLAALARTVGHDPRGQPGLPAVPAYRDRYLSTWPALYAWLRDRVAETPDIVMLEGRKLATVTDGADHATLHFSDGSQALARAVIGADGYHSTVRRALAPDQALARYAGYLVWRGLVDERVLNQPVSWPSAGGLWIDFVHGHRLVAAVLPGRDGSLIPGQRQVTFAWFDVNQAALLRRHGCLTPEGYIVGTLGRDVIEADTRAALTALVPQLWPQHWVEAVTVGLNTREVLSGAPIAEYQPESLAKGRLAIVGDAAHVVTPMTGSGFATSMDDAAVLAGLLAAQPHAVSVPTALAQYQAARMPDVRALVGHSMKLSAEFVRYAVAQRPPAA